MLWETRIEDREKDGGRSKIKKRILKREKKGRLKGEGDGRRENDESLRANRLEL